MRTNNALVCACFSASFSLRRVFKFVRVCGANRGRVQQKLSPSIVVLQSLLAQFTGSTFLLSSHCGTVYDHYDDCS